jgi:hypothetical protein
LAMKIVVRPSDLKYGYRRLADEDGVTGQAS